ncbi:MAG: hypothetical protein ACPGQS_05080, partial [Bradymonadia bacterium]
PVVFYEAGIKLRARFIPSVSLGYFEKALKLGAYHNDPIIFSTIAEQLAEELPYDDSGRSAYALKLGQRYFDNDLKTWARKAKSETSIESALNGHVAYPSLIGDRWSTDQLNAMLQILRAKPGDKSLSRFVETINGSKNAPAWMWTFLRALKAHRVLTKFSEQQRTVLNALLARDTPKSSKP